MVAHAFNYRNGTGISDTETFTGHTVDVRLTAGRSVESHVSDNDIFILFILDSLRRVYDQLSSGKTLSKVIIAVTHQLQGQPLRNKGSEALSSCTVTFYGIGILFQCVPAHPGDFRTEDRTKRPVRIFYIHFNASLLFLLQSTS